MKYYISTSLTRMKEHNIVRDSLCELGHQISYDWTSHGSVKTVSKERLAEVAENEVVGLDGAEVVIVLLPGGGGTHVEIGLALALKKKIFIHARDPNLFELGPQTNAFYHHPDAVQLTCPLEEVAQVVNAAISEPVEL